MPCDTIRKTPEQTSEERRLEITRSIQRLQEGLANGTVTAVVGPTGGVTFRGWTGQSDRVTDLCAYRRLMATNSPELRRAMAKAEALAGRGVSQTALASGLHSHDGGKTWGTH